MIREHEPYAMPPRVMDTPDAYELRRRFRRHSEMIPLTEASRMIGFAPQTLTMFVSQRSHACPFPVIRDGVRYHVRKEDVLDYIEQHRELVETRLAMRRQGVNVRRAWKVTA